MYNAPKKKELKQFGFLIALCFPILIGLIIPIIGGHSLRLWTLWIGLPFLILALLKPRALFYPYQIWMKLGQLLGWINSRLIFGLIFILILLPIGFVMRILGYDPLRKNKNSGKSYREDKINHETDLKRIF